MADLPRLNKVIGALESGKHAFTTFAAPEIAAAQTVNGAPYDGVVFELEHNPYEIGKLRDAMQYMLDRRQILKSGSPAPAVTPIVRIPPNGGDMNQWVAKQVLDVGVFGVVWPHVSTVEEARNAVRACRYARPPSAPIYEPAGLRGDGPTKALKYWGISQEEYYERADVWPLDPKGEILVIIMCEEARAIKNLPQILKEVQGIGVVLIGEGDLSQDLGFPRQYSHPVVASAISEIVGICKEANVPCGHPHVGSANVESVLEQGFRFLMASPVTTFGALEKGRKLTGRA